MTHPYPPHHPLLPYTGKHHYFLTFCTHERASVFSDSQAVELVMVQFVRAATQYRFELVAYCFMPDHVHLLVRGQTEDADCRRFIKAAKQYSGYYFSRQWPPPLWQRYGFERVIRDDAERAFTIGYIVANPVRSGLVKHPSEYPHLGSQCYPVATLLQICEYRGA
jgi:putative transposase